MKYLAALGFLGMASAFQTVEITSGTCESNGYETLTETECDSVFRMNEYVQVFDDYGTWCDPRVSPASTVSKSIRPYNGHAGVERPAFPYIDPCYKACLQNVSNVTYENGLGTSTLTASDYFENTVSWSFMVLGSSETYEGDLGRCYCFSGIEPSTCENRTLATNVGDWAQFRMPPVSGCTRRGYEYYFKEAYTTFQEGIACGTNGHNCICKGSVAATCSLPSHSFAFEIIPNWWWDTDEMALRCAEPHIRCNADMSRVYLKLENGVYDQVSNGWNIEDANGNIVLKLRDSYLKNDWGSKIKYRDLNGYLHQGIVYPGTLSDTQFIEIFNGNSDSSIFCNANTAWENLNTPGGGDAEDTGGAVEGSCDPNTCTGCTPAEYIDAQCCTCQ